MQPRARDKLPSSPLSLCLKTSPPHRTQLLKEDITKRNENFVLHCPIRQTVPTCSPLSEMSLHAQLYVNLTKPRTVRSHRRDTLRDNATQSRHARFPLHLLDHVRSVVASSGIFKSVVGGHITLARENTCAYNKEYEKKIRTGASWF